MEYNICYNMDKSCRIIWNKNSKFQKTTHSIILGLFSSQEHKKLKPTHICGKTSLKKKAIKIRTVIMSGGGEEDGERRGEIYASGCRLFSKFFNFLIGWDFTNIHYIVLYKLICVICKFDCFE